MFCKNEEKLNFSAVEKYRMPVYVSKGRDKYVYFYVLDPRSEAMGTPRLKRIKKSFNRYKSKRERDEAAMRFCYEVSSKLQGGWNPLVSTTVRRVFCTMDEVLDKWLRVAKKMLDDDIMRMSTFNNYKCRIRRFREWCAAQMPPIEFVNQLSVRCIENFLEYVYLQKKVSPKTRNNYHNWLGGLCHWMKSNGYLTDNPVEQVSRMREKDKFRKAIDPIDMKALSAYLQEHDRHFLLACYILYYTMVRPNEMSHLRIEDFRLKEQTLFVSHTYSKNRKDAVVTVPARVIHLMIDLGIFDYPGNYYLFGKDMKPSMQRADGRIFRQRWVKIRPKLGFPETYQFYSLKDAGISDAIDCVGLVVTKDQARHSNIATTNKYVRKDQMSAHPELMNFEGNL
ncbi:MAG: tyrosine-type recombinase/integrase [Bacteroides sp.]